MPEAMTTTVSEAATPRRTADHSQRQLVVATRPTHVARAVAITRRLGGDSPPSATRVGSGMQKLGHEGWPQKRYAKTKAANVSN